jgi:hypothetical protein
MVHALNEISRILSPNGFLIDIRPLAERWPVEVASMREIREAGRVSDLVEGLEDDQAAAQAMSQAIAQHQYAVDRVEFFPFYYYWDTPNEMKEYIETEWEGFAGIATTEWGTIRAMWASAEADARLRVGIKIQITRLAKATTS